MVVALAGPAPADSPEPVGVDAGSGRQWVPADAFWDEFDAPRVDVDKWQTDPEQLRSWTWSQKNVFVNGGVLNLRMTHEPHQRFDRFSRGPKEFQYKSGILRSREKTTYGYFEARVRGCSRFPGASPAIWLYSQGVPETPSPVKYCEIDVFELQQGGRDPRTGAVNGVRKVDMNLHARVEIDGQDKFLRPSNAPDLCERHWEAPFDPREDFHVYGCDVTPEEIVWYVDGVERAREKNEYWRRPMFVTLSLGLRSPFIGWKDGEMQTVPSAATAEGFPTDMRVDYVRAWTRSPAPEAGDGLDR
ncbi:family 16 glycosylhydrolase [Alienimonas sp. DA493]|uniref:family 16 glycosylhydrolase n=1 Tax=Alienimonas sp. DA493 TaxID=3373605 RepID=UPI003755137C